MFPYCVIKTYKIKAYTFIAKFLPVRISTPPSYWNNEMWHLQTIPLLSLKQKQNTKKE